MKASHSMSTAVNTNEQNEKRVLSIFDKYQENDKKLSIGGKFKGRHHNFFFVELFFRKKL